MANEKLSLSPESLANQGGKFELMSPYNFLTEFVQTARVAKDRLYVQAMYFEDDHVFAPMANALKQSAMRLVDTRLTFDYFTFMVSEGRINYLPIFSASDRDYRDLKKARVHALTKELQQAGVRVTVTNPPKPIDKLIPTLGRNHKKTVIIDDKAWLGGLNYSQKDFNRPDFMVRIEEPSIVEALSSQYDTANENRPHKDYSISCNPGTALLVDVGTPNKSLILDTATDLVSKAKKSVKVITQFNPDGKFLEALHHAHTRGVDASVIVSNPDFITEKLAWIFDRNSHLHMYGKGLQIPINHYPGWVHSKLLLVDDDSGSNGQVLFGSHNLSNDGVKMGTEEIALLSGDSDLIVPLRTYFNKMK
ncbi:MAG: phosphatidylserine/phosphatidylglycerophosphate/cardiolipin synthase family protein [Candidatus Roizmanbacteria bacterium]